MQIGGLLLRSGKADEALKKADLVLTGDPKHEDAHILKGAALLAKKETDAALKFLRDAVGSHVRKPDGYLMLNLAYLQKGDAPGAEKTLREDHNKSVPPTSPWWTSRRRSSLPRRSRSRGRSSRSRPPSYSTAWPWQGCSGIEGAGGGGTLPSSRRSPKGGAWVQVAAVYLVRNKVADAERELREGIRLNQKSFDPLRAGGLGTNCSDVTPGMPGAEKDPANRDHAVEERLAHPLCAEEIDKRRSMWR